MIFNGKSTLLRGVTEHDKQPPKTMAVIRENGQASNFEGTLFFRHTQL
jgi:hypothetical protein